MAIVPDNSYISPRRMMRGTEIVAKALREFGHWTFNFSTQPRLGDGEWKTTFQAPDGTTWVLEVRPAVDKE